MAGGPGHTSRIFAARFRPDSDSSFVTVGVKHVRFWTVAGGELISKKGVLAAVSEDGTESKMQTFLSLAFGAVSIIF